MINSVTLIGRVGQEPDLKYTSNGNPVCNLSIATSERWKDKDGVKKEKTEWHRVILYSKLAEVAPSFLNKGKLVYVEGKLQTRQWEDKGGVKHYTTEILANNVRLLQFEKKEEAAQTTSSPNMKPVGQTVAEVAKEFGVKQEEIDYQNFTSEDIPF